MPPLEERTEYPYQNIRTKNYQWGNGDKVSKEAFVCIGSLRQFANSVLDSFVSSPDIYDEPRGTARYTALPNPRCDRTATLTM